MTVLGQLPGLVSAFSKYNYLSLYQPSVYKGFEPLLFFPLAVGVLATWFAHKYSAKAIPVLGSLMDFLGIVVAAIYFTFDTNDLIHSFNWALSYCVIAIFAAILYRVVADIIP
jgi:hypothetical protein